MYPNNVSSDIQFDKLLTPAEWTIHFGIPVVPEEYMINRGWLKGSGSNVSSDCSKPRTKSSNNTLNKNRKKQSSGLNN